jgi:hypothetical protein
MKINLSIREIEGNAVHWYATSGMERVDGYTRVLLRETPPTLADVVRVEGGDAMFKSKLKSLFEIKAQTLKEEEQQKANNNFRVIKSFEGEEWANVSEFATWWLKERTLLVPFNAEVICSDDATAICLFRKGQYQVEIYLSHPGEVIKDHCHPGVQALVVKLGGGGEGEMAENGGSTIRFQRAPVLEAGEYHGNETVSPSRGYLVFQHWESWLGTPTSAAIQWQGPPAGPKHEKIINLKLNE